MSRCLAEHSGKHETYTQCWINAGPPSQYTNIRYTYRICNMAVKVRSNRNRSCNAKTLVHCLTRWLNIHQIGWAVLLYKAKRPFGFAWQNCRRGLLADPIYNVCSPMPTVQLCCVLLKSLTFEHISVVRYLIFSACRDVPWIQRTGVSFFIIFHSYDYSKNDQ